MPVSWRSILPRTDAFSFYRLIIAPLGSASWCGGVFSWATISQNGPPWAPSGVWTLEAATREPGPGNEGSDLPFLPFLLYFCLTGVVWTLVKWDVLESGYVWGKNNIFQQVKMKRWPRKDIFWLKLSQQLTVGLMELVSNAGEELARLPGCCLRLPLSTFITEF